MKIRVDEILSGGLHKEADYDPSEMDVEIEESETAPPVKFLTPINIKADITLADKELIVNSVLRYKLKAVCSRCLEEFELSFEKKHIFTYDVRNLDAVDITDNVREEIILDYPLKPLCKEECRGICIKCKVNLNIEECRCGNEKHPM